MGSALHTRENIVQSATHSSGKGDKMKYKASTKAFWMVAVLAAALFVLSKAQSVAGCITAVIVFIGGMILIERIIGRNYTHR